MGRAGAAMADEAQRAEKLRRLALSRPPCKGCGGIPQDPTTQRVRLVNTKSHKAAWFPLCGPCRGALVDRRFAEDLPPHLLKFQHWV